MENSNNRTCGECLYLDKRVACNDYTRCSCKEQKYSFVDPKFSACRYFEPAKKPTNGDKIRNFTDEELAEKFVYQVNYDYCYSEFYSTLIPDKEFDSKQEAIAATIVELEKEVKDE